MRDRLPALAESILEEWMLAQGGEAWHGASSLVLSVRTGQHPRRGARRPALCERARRRP